jgi:uncharacterized repeat protein (TIGR03803 family)
MPKQRQGRRIKRSSRSICWLVGILLSLAFSGLVQGQEVSILHSFGDGSVTGDGGVPVAALADGIDGNFYGTSLAGGSGTGGCAFAITPQGAVTILHKFGDGTVPNDGVIPAAGLILASNGSFYGTTSSGGSAGKGTVFAMTSGGGVTVLHSFGSVPNDGIDPVAGLIEDSDGIFYGTTSQGGTAGKGTVFEITGQQVTILHSFGDGTVHNDGTSPGVGLVVDDQGNLYGTTATGGSANLGTVYKINSQKQVTILHSFTQPLSVSFDTGAPPNGSGGYSPNSRLALGTDGNLYGTTAASGYGYGTIFKITPRGQETVLHYFGDGTVANDGMEGIQGDNVLTLGLDGNFYGTTIGGGAAGKGALFKMTPDGQVTILHSFGDGTVVNDGTLPEAGVVEDSNGNFYGTTSDGGSAGLGAVFKVASALPTIISGLSMDGAVGLAFSYQTLATQTPTTYSAIGLQLGLNIDSTTGLISGAPTATGTSSVTLTATNAAGSNSVTLVITILPPPVITSILSEFGSTSAAFYYQIRASGNPASFDATGLPDGLTLDPATGMITGTPTSTGTFPVTISATNVAGSDSRTLMVVVTNSAPTLSQEYVQLHSFNDGTVSNEGVYPGPLIQARDSTFYVMTAPGGGTSSASIVRPSATGDASVVAGLGTASGSTPQGLVQGIDGNFYGTTSDGGSAGLGTVFKMTQDGVVTVLHNFLRTTSDGANPQGGVIQGIDGNFYGTTQFGGAANLGTIFRITSQGALTILYSFTGVTHNDGAQPVAPLVQDGGEFIYGTTVQGGVSLGDPLQITDGSTQTVDGGTFFKLDTGNGTVTILHDFGQGNDGRRPNALVDSGGKLFGTTVIGGTAGKGTIFEITTSGAVTILHNFGDGSVINDGINPLGALVAFPLPSGGTTLFGITQSGGATGQGTAFELDPSGALTILHSFGDASVPDDGTTPLGGLTLGSDGNLYGTTTGGGAGYGTFYAIVTNLLPPPPTPAPVSYWTLTGALPSGLTFDSTTGIISGAPFPDDSIGVYAVSISHVVDLLAGQPQNIDIDLAQRFSLWVTAHSVSSDPTATSSDGVPNLLKYLYNINPTAPISAADRAMLPTPAMDTTTTPGTTYLALTYRQYALATRVTVHVQTSSDLQTWTTVDPPDVCRQVGKDGTTGDPIMEIGVIANGSSGQFIRLNVTSP